MKSEKSIFIAFILNLLFSVFEFVGGLYCGSTAIMSDALHDLGDAVGIGLSFIFERVSKRPPDERYTYGYGRYSVLGGAVSTIILLFGSLGVIAVGIGRIFSPTPINYDGMILFAVIGVAVNLAAAYFTREKGSINRCAVNLHMLEDVLGWAAVLVSAVVMRFCDVAVLDPVISVVIAVFIIVGAVRNLGEVLGVILEKTPHALSVGTVRESVIGIEGVFDVHHIHLWSVDGQVSLATLHVVCDGDLLSVKREVRRQLCEMGIAHVTVELELRGEECGESVCSVRSDEVQHAHHHHCHSHSH